VFIHGLADRSASFLLPAFLLSKQFRCIGYELPEGGGDGARIRRYSHADLVGDLGALLDSLKIDRAYLFGSSFGSTIALEALRGDPRRYPRALLQGGFARRPLLFGEHLLASALRFCPGRLRHLPLRRRGMYRHSKGPLAERTDLWEYFLDCAGEPRIQAVARRALLLAGLDLRATLGEVRQPVLLVCGDHDPLVGKMCEEELLQGLPSAERIEIPGCGHYPYFSHPEVLSEIVRTFLTPRTGQ
jgi:pimeloyl-ACP methyl ester carboxylesterase